MNNIAIITGASSGLGKQFVKTIIHEYPNLKEIWIIARRAERLQQLAELYSQVKIRAIPLDLSKEDSYEEFAEILKEKSPQIRIVINNAGLEKDGTFEKMNLSDLKDMVDVNIMGVTAISRLCFPYMNKGSFMIVTGSVSSFVPIPKQAVYSSTKSYISFLCRVLHEEMKKKNVNVCLLNPGNMDTEMNIRDSSESQGKMGIHLPYLNLEQVTKKTLKKAQAGKSVYTPGAFYKFYRLVSKIFPISFMMNFTKRYYK